MADAPVPIVKSPSGSTSTPQVVVFFRDSDSKDVIRHALGDLSVTDAVFKPGGLSSAIAEVTEQSSPRLLIVDSSGMDDPAAAVAQLIELCEPSTGVIVIGDSNDIRLYRALRDAGAAEYFFKPLVAALVARTCKAVLTNEQEPAQAHGPTKPRTGRLILVLGARGGVGATTVAVRTAWRLSENPPRPVAIVDLDLQFGDAALQLEATPTHAMREALERADRVDDLFLERGIIHVTKRLDLMACLEPLAGGIAFEESAFLTLLEILRRRYRYVVVDLPASRAVALPQVLRLPSLVMVVSDAGLASARDVARLREVLGPSRPDRVVMHLLNKNGAPGSLPLEEFARGAGQPPDVIIPWSRDIATAASLGLKLKPDCPTLDHALAPVFARVAGERGQPTQSLLSKWFR
jgi:pilus assembly protein CpaE